MDDWGQWDHYVEYVCPRSGVRCRERCLGMGTATVLAEQKRQLGYWKVQIVHRRFSRHKEVQARVYGR